MNQLADDHAGTDTGYVTYQFGVLDDTTVGRPVGLEVWASPEESPYVEVSLALADNAESVGLAPQDAVALAEALERRAPVDVPARDDYDDSPAQIRLSWDDEGADLLVVLSDRPVRVVIDYHDQPPRIAAALRECAAQLETTTG